MARQQRTVDPWANVQSSIPYGVPSGRWLPESFGTRLVSLASARLKADTSLRGLSALHPSMSRT